MDILYQFYIHFFENFRISEALVIAIWFVLPFCLTVLALIFVVFVLYFIEKKLVIPFIAKSNKQAEYVEPVCGGHLLDPKFSCEDCGANNVNKLLLVLASVIVFAPIIMGWAVIPYSNKYMPVSSGVNLVLFLSIWVLPLIGIILLGVAGKSRFFLHKVLISSVRSISYGIPMMISVLGVVVLASSLNINEIVLAQSVTLGALGWYFIPMFVAFLIFFIGMIVQIDCISFNFPSGYEDTVFSSEDGGINPCSTIFTLVEYSAMFVMALFFVCLFLGGYLPPLGFYLSELYEINYIFNTTAVYFEQIFWLIAKTFLVVFVLMWVRGLLPFVKSKKFIKFAWRWLIPLSVANFIFVCIFKHLIGMGVL